MAGEERFWSRVDKSGECWAWKGSVCSNGYGRVSVNGALTGAHRHAWAITNGPIPEGICVLHRCDNPPCVNPAHLWLGTQLENIQDRVAKGRNGATGSKHGADGYNAKLTSEAVSEIRSRYAAGGITQQQLGEAHGVNRSTIGYIVRNNTWKHETTTESR